MASKEEIEENSMYLWKIISHYNEDYVNKEDSAKRITELLDSGNIDINRSYGRNKTTPLHLASLYGIENIVEKLIEKGAEIDKANRIRETPLNIATINGHLDIVKILLEKGAEIDSKDKEGYTPLNTAVLQGYLDIVKILLEKGADRKIANNDGQTPFDIAMKRFIDTGDNKYSILSKMIGDEASNDGQTDSGKSQTQLPPLITSKTQLPPLITSKPTLPIGKLQGDYGNNNTLLGTRNGLLPPINTRKGGKHRRQKTRRRRNKKSNKKRR